MKLKKLWSTGHVGLPLTCSPFNNKEISKALHVRLRWEWIQFNNKKKNTTSTKLSLTPIIFRGRLCVNFHLFKVIYLEYWDEFNPGFFECLLLIAHVLTNIYHLKLADRFEFELDRTRSIFKPKLIVRNPGLFFNKCISFYFNFSPPFLEH